MGYLSSSIGRKQIMGLTGLGWSGFVLSHMLGNMLILKGADAYNTYSHALITNPFLIIAELGLVALLLFHVVDGLWLTWQNRRARPAKYAMSPNGEKAPRFQSRFMIFHGSLLLVFIVLHIATFKYGTHYETTVDGVVMRDLHRLIVEVFRQPGYVVWYCVALVALLFHLSHGFYSAFASLGFYHPRYSPWLSRFGFVYAAVVFAGFVSQPIYVYFFAP